GGRLRPPRQGGISLPLPARSPPSGVRVDFSLSASCTDTAANTDGTTNANANAPAAIQLFFFIMRPLFYRSVRQSSRSKNKETCRDAQIKLLLTTSYTSFDRLPCSLIRCKRAFITCPAAGTRRCQRVNGVNKRAAICGLLAFSVSTASANRS